MIESILLSMLLGSLIGIERHQKHKSAGIKTMALICLGSCLYSQISVNFGLDQTRVIAQIVSGIGFIGAGVIFKSGLDIKGLTTAATIWVTSAVGVMCGLMNFQYAIITTICVWVINILYGEFINNSNNEKQ